MTSRETKTLGWGSVTTEGAEMWDAAPVVRHASAGFIDWLRLLFYPKKFLLYRYLWRAAKKQPSGYALRILDVGCGTGGAVIDLKNIFGKRAEVVGVDVVQLQIDVAKEKLRQYGIAAEARWYDGTTLPFPDGSFDAVYTSDVLGHVVDVSAWLQELQRVLRPGGYLAMFSESALGRHAWIRKYLFHRGLNIDPHAAFHISLYSKSELVRRITTAGFLVRQIYTIFWAAFFMHPDEFYAPLQAQTKFPILRGVNKFLYFIKQKTRPWSLAFAELYGLIEMVTVGRFVESQGYVILGEKK